MPAPSVTIIALSDQTVGQSLTLESNITTVRGIISRVDIVWRSNGIIVKRTMGTIPNLTSISSEVYNDVYHIPLLSTIDDAAVFQCKAEIMTTPSTTATDMITLNVTGK